MRKLPGHQVSGKFTPDYHLVVRPWLAVATLSWVCYNLFAAQLFLKNSVPLGLVSVWRGRTPRVPACSCLQLDVNTKYECLLHASGELMNSFIKLLA